jgi:hypothetical protein
MEMTMTRKILAGAIALALVSCCGARLALADNSPVPSRAAMTEGANPERAMPRGTDLRPCEPGKHSEFSRLSGGYHCMRNP